MKLFAFIFAAMLFLQVPNTAVAQETIPPDPAPRIDRPDTPPVQNDPDNPGQLTGQDNENTQELYPNANIQEREQQSPPLPDTSDPGPPQPVTLSAAIKENGPIIPDGLTWRVFDTRTDETGQLALLFRSEEPTPSLSLPVGEYVVHASYGRAQTSDSLTVVSGPNFKTIILDAGALRLRGAVSNQVDIPTEQLRFDIFAEGTEGGQVPVVLDINQNELIYLNAGIYQIVSRWGNENAMVKADIRVEPGQITEATLFHNAAQVSFSLVSTIGGEAIADVDWQVQDMEGTTLYTHLGAFPTAVLAAGDYVVFAKSGDQVYNREFQVQAGPPINIEVLTSIY